MLELRGVRHRYAGRTVLALEHFTLARGDLVAIVGPNGSGKSTLLRLAALLEAPTDGAVWLDDRPAPRTAATRRRVTLVEQRPVLFRGSVRENLGYGLSARAVGHAERQRRVDAVIERLGLATVCDRQRRELSEGEIQRVAVARALVLEPEILLLDEPVSSADRAAAQRLYQTLQEERRGRGLTICLASHQLEDAYRWADDLRALADGRIVPVTPENLFRVELPAGPADVTRHVRVGPLEIAVATDRTGGGPAILAVPPSDIILSREPVASSARNVFSGRVTRLARPRPGLVHVTAEVGIELVAAVTEEAVRELGLLPGAPVTCAFKASAVRVF